MSCLGFLTFILGFFMMVLAMVAFGIGQLCELVIYALGELAGLLF